MSFAEVFNYSGFPNNFQIWNPVKVIYGPGKIANVKDYLNCDKPLIICDAIMEKLGISKKLASLFHKSYVFSKVEPNPSCELVNEVVNAYSGYDIDCVIGLGGGSSLDTAKAVSGLLKEKKLIEDYLVGNEHFKSRLNLVLIPTTAGTGSEVTNVGVYTYKGIKRPMTSDIFWADLAIVDPELTYSMPHRITASTGLDAFTHAVESYWAKSTQPYTEGLALSSLRLIYKSLKDSINGEKNARNIMALASTIAGIAFSQTRTTAAHAISFPLTSLYGIEHGIAVAIPLTELIKYTYPNVKEKMDALIRYLGVESIDELINFIRNIMESAGISTRLRDYGVSLDDIENIAKISMEANIMKLTPGDITFDDVVLMLKNLL